jgi:hypothetical protein
LVNDNAGGLDENPNNAEPQQEPEVEFKAEHPVSADKKPGHESSTKDLTGDSQSEEV